MEHYFIGRQAIFGRNANVIGYKLLYRDSDTHRANIKDADQATSQVIFNSCMEVGRNLIRGKHCELLAETHKLPNKNQYFTVGLFSALDAIMDRPMEELLAELPLADEIKSALLNRDGELGTMLQQVLYYEMSEWDKLDNGLFEADNYKDTYLAALQWADSVTREFSQ